MSHSNRIFSCKVQDILILHYTWIIFCMFPPKCKGDFKMLSDSKDETLHQTAPRFNTRGHKSHRMAPLQKLQCRRNRAPCQINPYTAIGTACLCWKARSQDNNAKSKNFLEAWCSCSWQHRMYPVADQCPHQPAATSMASVHLMFGGN